MISFAATGGTWTPSRNPTRPQHALQTVQASTRSGSLTYGYNPIVSLDIVTYTWPFLLDAEVTALLSFFVGTVKGMALEFTVTTPEGDTFTGAFAAPRIDITDKAYGGKQVSLSIRRVL